jgi:outer membrane receptor for ferrienterochelin and colicin
VVHGKGTRVKFAFYVNYELGIEPLTFTTGIRFDAIHDHYDGTLPPLDVRAKHLALSPKLGINYRYASSPSYAGSVFANVNRSFKAATLDQLFDQRPTEAGVFIPTRDGSYFFTSQSFPPFSNPLLRPQSGTSYEIGTYQRMSFSRNFYGELTASYYQIDMEDEIDFDLATFKYQNLHTTQHRGIESGVKLYLLPGSTMFFNYTWTSVKFTNGNYEGNFLKGIPRNVITVGAAYKFSFGLLTSVMWNFVNGTYLDDENTTLLSYHKANVRCSYTYSPVTVFVDVDNVLNRQYSSTGYILNGITYLYPAAGRIVRGGINLEL